MFPCGSGIRTSISKRRAKRGTRRGKQWDDRFLVLSHAQWLLFVYNVKRSISYLVEGSEMSLSRKHLGSGRIPLNFAVHMLGRTIQLECAHVIFAFLLGSSKDGHVPVGSDLDIVLYVEGNASWDMISQVMEIAERFAPGVHYDVGILNVSDPVYRFEALKG